MKAWNVRPLSAAERFEAIGLFHREISLFDARSYSQGLAEVEAVRRWIVQETNEAPPDDSWLGVVEGGRVLGAFHASPHYGQVLPQILKNVDPGVLMKYMRDVASLEDMAVEREFRGQGLGRALVEAGLAELKARSVIDTVGFACDPPAAEFFKAAGFTVGGYMEPVPADKAGGYPTYYMGPREGRFFWKRLRGSAFFN